MKKFVIPAKAGILSVALWCGFFSIAHAAEYIVDKAASSIAFSGTHAGKPFKGTFGTWDAAITFDAANLAASSVKVTIDTASAKTGDAMYDGTLPTADWFDVKNHPQATFISESIEKKEAGYSAKGTLTIRGKAVPVAFDFALSDLAAPPVKTTFTLTLDRLAHDIGLKSDAKAEWVSKDIPISVTLAASPK
ncbi:MAG: YceI family protein [Rickettsiales bacterium]|jgi:polyisoprenoid-binding protein YceI|nr:YceI family protein [Rickettsiales bacterium]